MGAGIRLADLLAENGIQLEDLMFETKDEESTSTPQSSRLSKRKRRAEQKHVRGRWETVLFTLYLVVLHHKGMNHTQMTQHNDHYDLTPAFPPGKPGAPTV